MKGVPQGAERARIHAEERIQVVDLKQKMQQASALIAASVFCRKSYG
jgi:hypothetical protein